MKATLFKAIIKFCNTKKNHGLKLNKERILMDNSVCQLKVNVQLNCI